VRAPPLVALAFAMLVLAPGVRAQEEPNTIFGAYYRCNQAEEARADTIYLEVMAPIWQKQVDAGRITTFGWARHWAGGAWRRLAYMVGTDRDMMIDARIAAIEEAQTHREEMREFNSICSSHDDYIWLRVASSESRPTAAQDRPDVGLTSYMVCDSRENEADEIMQTAFSPILNRHVQAGDISSWSWLEHGVGGWYRRALVLDAADYKSMLDYWEKLWSDLEAEQPELLREFASICESHTDYVWDLSFGR
jgi:hypothetical protein